LSGPLAAARHHQSMTPHSLDAQKINGWHQWPA
jgi:hypothetical protein